MNKREAARTLVLGILLFLAASCSSDAEEVVSVTSTAQATITVPSTVSIATTTTALLPTTTVEVESVARAEVDAAFDHQFDVWRSCTADYDACDPEAEFIDVYTARTLTNLTNIVLDKQGNGRKNTPLDPDLDFQRIDSIEFTSVDFTTATVGYCTVDSRMVSVTDEVGEDVVFDDAVVHQEGFAFYVLGDDSVWRLARFDVIMGSSEVAICDG